MLISSYFQPIVDLATCDIYGYEMLARGAGEYFYPDKIFQYAKENNAEWEIECNCRIAALNKISSLDKTYNDKFFFLNVSPNVFNNPEFVSGFTSNYIKQQGLNHRKIVLEITETATIEHYEVFEQLIKHYVEQGFKVALDDFGAGHSGLTTLVAMTPHYMKVDKDIIIGINCSAYKQKLLKTLCNFASDVGSYVLAEGIENFKDLETVYRLGVRYVQGYFLGRPSPFAEELTSEKKDILNQLISRLKISEISTVLFLKDIIIVPDVFTHETLTCGELDLFFKRNQMVDHIIITRDDYPIKLVTRQMFYKYLSGRFGFAIFSSKFVEDIVDMDFLTINKNVDLLTIKKIALNRKGNEAFDPIVIVNNSGYFYGTITMKKLIEKAIDLEIFNATDQNPLTYLPGNGSIKKWLTNLMNKPEYTIVYIDIDHFKQYNDCYGFSCGDSMILLVADILKEFKMESSDKILAGHIGGDDFIMLTDEIIDENVLINICKEFDRRKIELFNEKDIDNSVYKTVDRDGTIKHYPLTTISLAAFTNYNFNKNININELGQYVASLKTKAKQQSYSSGKSGYIFERRIY